MTKLSEIFAKKNRTFSFELFPPKTEKGYQNLLNTIALLTKLSPDFISVTYGAGGGERKKTIQLVDYIQKHHHIIGVAHLTCVIHTKEEIKSIVENIKNHGIENILALRGDPPANQPDWQPGENNYKYSHELCSFIRSVFGKDFTIGVAGFPEGHLLSPDKETDAKYLKLKIDSGADFVITQLFFNNQDYFDYVRRLRKLNVTQRIIPGVLPITDYKGTVNFCQRCGTTLPEEIHKIFAPLKDSKEDTIKEGIKFAIRQCRGLLDNGAPGIHFYTLNKIHPVDTILSEIRK